MSGCPHDIPAMKVSTGNLSDFNSINITASYGFIRYDTSYHNLEIFEENGWRDIVINNKPEIDISGKIIVNDISINSNLIALDASINNIEPIDGSLTIIGDLSVNGNVISNNGELGFAGKWDISSNNNSAYRFIGNGLTGNEDNPTLYLMRGSKYKFINNMNAHPFRIKDSDGNHHDGLTSGVSSGTLIFNVNQDASSELEYYCTTHNDMKGILKIIGEGNVSESGSQNLFSKITITGQNDIIADSSTSVLTFEAGNNITLATDSNNKKVTITSTGGGGGGGSGEDASFNRIGEYIDGSGTTFINTIDVIGKVRATDDVISFYSSSDINLKTNIRTIENASEIINNIRGVRFNWNNNAYDINSNVDLSNDEIGVIAQEIEQILPEVIKPGLQNYKAVRYENIVAVLIEGIHELQKKMSFMEKEIKELKEKQM